MGNSKNYGGFDWEGFEKTNLTLAYMTKSWNLCNQHLPLAGTEPEEISLLGSVQKWFIVLCLMLQ